ncbi:hypothetical protein [Paraburkholderia caledonica]|uniref:hypothetical protein n=1 Tax=Paraburkholderia caledonica TaxID=134536 RepID=UPI00036ED862|nr:hypothetical protein [Paraburkholderia caledonica]
MQSLINKAIEAHGGMKRWNEVREISVIAVPDGVALHLRGQAAFAKTPTRVTVQTRSEKATFDPFLAPRQIGVFEPFRTAVKRSDGVVLEELDNPRGSFKPDTPWSGAQLAYFAGYAMWTYLTLPFSLLTDGVRCEEAGSLSEDHQTWRAVKVTFPESYVTHSTEQVLYFDDNGLIRRHDYSVDIAANGTAAHYLYDHREYGGIVFATRRRIYPRGPDQRPNMAVVVMAVDLSDFELSGVALR